MRFVWKEFFPWKLWTKKKFTSFTMEKNISSGKKSEFLLPKQLFFLFFLPSLRLRFFEQIAIFNNYSHIVWLARRMIRNSYVHFNDVQSLWSLSMSIRQVDAVSWQSAFDMITESNVFVTMNTNTVFCQYFFVRQYFFVCSNIRIYLFNKSNQSILICTNCCSFTVFHWW